MFDIEIEISKSKNNLGKWSTKFTLVLRWQNYIIDKLWKSIA